MLYLQAVGLCSIALIVTFVALKELLSSLFLARKLRRLHCTIPPRYPQKIPYFGSDLSMILDRSRQKGALFSKLQQLFRAYGKTFQAKIWGQTIVYTIDSTNIQFIHTREFKSFGVEPIRKTVNQGWMGDGIFVSDGPIWKHSRTLLKPAFSKNQFADLSSLDVHVRRLLALVPLDGTTVDLQLLFQRLFLDVSTEFLFGESAQSLLPGFARLDVDQFNVSFNRALLGMTQRTASGRALALFNRDREWQEAYTKVHAVVDGYIDRALEQQHLANNAINPSTSVSSTSISGRRSFSMLHELVKDTQHRRFLRDQLLNVFLPARDSSAIGLSDLFFNLARHPEVWRKLRSEVLDIDQPLTFDLLKSMKYLQCVLNESLRLLAPADVSYRTCVSDCILPSGGVITGKEPIYIRRGTRLEMRFGVMHRDQDYWGPDAEEFRPERWLDDMRPKWKYIPFLGGARICPAQQMILTQYAFILVKFLRKFGEIENRDPEITFVEEIKFGKKSRNGVKVAFMVNCDALNG